MRFETGSWWATAGGTVGSMIYLGGFFGGVFIFDLFVAPLIVEYLP